VNYSNDLSYATANGVSDLMETQAHIQKAIERLTRASKELPEVVDARYPEDARQLYLTLRQQVIHAHQVIAYLQSNALPQTIQGLNTLHNLIRSGALQPNNDPLPPQEACDQAVLVFMRSFNRPVDLSTIRNKLPGGSAGSELVRQSFQNLLAAQQIVPIGDRRGVYVYCHPQELTAEQQQHVDLARKRLQGWEAGDVVTPEHIYADLERGNQWRRKPITLPYYALYRYMQQFSEKPSVAGEEGTYNK